MLDKLINFNLGAEWLLSVNLLLVKNERTKLTQEFLKLVPMAEIEQEVFLTLLHLLKSKVKFILEFSYINKILIRLL